MNIKLNAKLSAYSKIESLEGCCQSIDFVTTENIDSLFDSSVCAEESLVQETTDKFVSFSDIDSLFG